MSDRLAEIERYFAQDGRDEHWFSDQEQEHIDWLIDEVKRLREIEIANGRMLEGYDECQAEVERLLQQRNEATKPLGVDVKGYNTVAEWNALVEENERLRRALLAIVDQDPGLGRGSVMQSYPGDQKPDWTGLDGYGDNAHAEPR